MRLKNEAVTNECIIYDSWMPMRDVHLLNSEKESIGFYANNSSKCRRRIYLNLIMLYAIMTIFSNYSIYNHFLQAC